MKMRHYPKRSLSIQLALIILACTFLTSTKATVTDDPLCDLAVTKTGPQQATPNTDLTYTITVTNNGPDPATNARVVDDLDSSLSFVSMNSPAGWTCNPPPVGTTGQIICTNPNYLPGTLDTFTLIAHSSPNTPTNNFITNKASVSAETFDSNEENDGSSATTLISTASGMTNVGIQIMANTESALAGTAITFTTSLNNSDLAQNVQLKDPLAGMTFVSVAAPTGWNCQAPASGATGTITCAIGSLPPTTDLKFIIVAKIPSDAVSGTTFTNIATVKTETYDSNAEDDSAATAVTVAPGYTITIASGDAQSTPIATTFPVPLQALVKDDAGNPAPGVTVNFQAPTTGSSATFISTNSNTETMATDENGIATSSTLTANSVAGGPYNVNATASQQTINFSLTNLKGNHTINFPSVPPKTYGDAPFSLQATASSGLPVSLSLISGPASLSGTTLTILAAGNITVRASQSGDANYNAATPANQTLSVSKALPTVNVTPSRNPADFGEQITFTAIVSGPPNASPPSGTVQFLDGNTNILGPVNCIASSNNCITQVSTSTLASGNHGITGKYSADQNYLQNIGTVANNQTIKPLPSISMSDVSDSEGNTGTKKFDFLVILSATSNLSIKVDYATADGTATSSNNDYLSTTGSVTFAPGEKIKTITVLVNGDINREADETFFVNIKNPVNASISRSQGIALILNDDTLNPPQLILEDSTTTPNQAAAIDSVLFLRDPFSVKSPATWLNLGSDSNTRLLIFASTLQLDKTDIPGSVVISITDANGANYNVPAEDVRPVPNQTDLTQITFRLPDNLPSGPSALLIKFHGLFSNQGIVHIK